VDGAADDAHAAPRFRQPPSRCPYCHDACDDDDAIAVCRQCLARHHADCWRAASACGACRGERVLLEWPSAALSAREYARAIEREPVWARRPVGAFMLLMTAVCLGFTAFMLRNVVRNVSDLGEVLLSLPVVGLLGLVPAWVCWRAARARLAPPGPTTPASDEPPGKKDPERKPAPRTFSG
jgi:hypothetical protein